MRKLGHLTPRYIVDRVANILFEKANPDLPWLTRDMIEILDSWLQPGDTGLEFGSGRSTRWFASRVSRLISVEDNREWYERVAPGIAAYPVEYHLCEDGTDESADSDYVGVVRQLPPESLDFCLVDGSARDHCAFESLARLRQGGILIIDNVNWYMPRESPSSAPNSRNQADGYASELWEKVGEELRDWRCVWTTNGVTDTAFWLKPR